MIRVAQTKFRDDHGEGNSLQACLASIFERPLDTVPHFRVVDDWWDSLQEWLQNEYGVWLLIMEMGPMFKHGPLGWHMTVGMTAHGRHVIVGHNGHLAYDPHRRAGDCSRRKSTTSSSAPSRAGPLRRSRTSASPSPSYEERTNGYVPSGKLQCDPSLAGYA